MNIEEFGNSISNKNDGVCIGISYNRKVYSDGFNNLRNFHECKSKIDEIKKRTLQFKI